MSAGLSDMSFHRQGGWRNQFHRLQRWHSRVTRLGPGTSPDEQDILYAFFQNCLALRDWLKHSGAVSAVDVDKFVRSNRELLLCRDLANGTKHYELSSPSIDANFFLCREYVPPSSAASRSGRDSRPVICSGGTKSDLFDLADTCMELWVEFLAAHSLLRS